MLRLIASLLIVVGLAFAPALMARASAAPAPTMEHCAGAMPRKHQGKADAKPCCTTACLSTAALPEAPMIEAFGLVTARPEATDRLTVAGLDPERDTPPPRAQA